MTPAEEERLSITIRKLIALVPPKDPINRRALLKELAPNFKGVGMEELSDWIVRHCEALGRRLSNERDSNADLKPSLWRPKPRGGGHAK
jgi:hypothetical protein